MKKMKKLFLLIGFMTLTMNGQGQNEYEESTFQGQEEVSQRNPKVDLINSNSVGQTIKIGNLEIMKKDLGLFNWDDANAGLSKLGGGWRLPTIKELLILKVNKKIIGGFDAEFYYWSSTLRKDANCSCDTYLSAELSNDRYAANESPSQVTDHNNVRAVRSIAPNQNLKKNKNYK